MTIIIISVYLWAIIGHQLSQFVEGSENPWIMGIILFLLGPLTWIDIAVTLYVGRK